MPEPSVAPPHVAVAVFMFDQALKDGLGLAAVRPVGSVISWLSARRTFSRDPVATRPESPGLGSAERSNPRRTSAAPRLGEFARTSAAAPTTCGVAMEVPLPVPYTPPGSVL